MEEAGEALLGHEWELSRGDRGTGQVRQRRQHVLEPGGGRDLAEDTLSYSRPKGWSQKALGGRRQGPKATAGIPKDVPAVM